MRYVRFTMDQESESRFGIVEGNSILECRGDLFDQPSLTGNSFSMTDVILKAPLTPRHIIGIGKNFAGEGESKPKPPELPIFFFKPLTSVVGPNEPILLPRGAAQVKYESELAVIIGKTARNIAPEAADDFIFGCTVANDVGAIDYFHPEGHWTIGKAFDTFCPLGPVIVTDFDYRQARIHSRLNGEQRQDAGMELIITPIDQMIAVISRFMTLMPGDVILTGTPAGAAVIRDGDMVDCLIDGIGCLSNPVRERSA
ncbi:2-keto-4-pentenoate hydratase/2-oxohepta-3-ene-1,7-dioic acid hydratase (catechol pathway) [Paenibacillus sp. UNC496MF]|uniref:fumarylacetoacetate hydrolase family protein n=1 Tax=Paenibacillus sp. UNC496MF TaxID=1502753 RepID=UPI0008E2D33C|nr:fumarylacetoacetate hydrolase family protein [Paenibacillus sp. UNC496MF]SFJ91367.1 2-keto-4-pentenoate hydratase/2-oxohepta-3-ene-1,7-dioic acid hydratase (catechol pathway) [Paenibacillus sp. UNC496MF]